MENFLEELNVQRRATIENIEKSFGVDIEKARSGVYADTAENRKKQRVGQHYGNEKKQEEQPHQRNAKPTEQKKKDGIKDSKRADAFMKMSNEEKEQIRAILQLANWKRADLSTVRVSKPQDGWRTVTAAGNEIGKVKADDVSDEVLKKIDWAADDGTDNGYNKEALEKFKKNKVREYYNNWNKDTDMFVSENKKYWEKTLKKEMGVDSYDDFEDADDWKKYNEAVKIALNAIPAEKWAELADDDEKEKLKKEPKQRTASSLSQEEREKKKSVRNKRNVIRALKTEVSGGKYLDGFLNENTEYFKDVLKKHSDDNVEDIYDLQEWLESRYENDEKDPYGYDKYDEIIYECLEKIPAEKFNDYKL